MNFKLRDYQLAAIQSAREALTKSRATIIKLATGLGKTIIGSNIIKSVDAKGGRALFLAHTDELVLQFEEKLRLSTGLTTHIEKAERTAHDKEGSCICASVQSLSRPNRLARYPKDHFNLIIVDECHRAAAKTYLAIIDHFPKAKVIGLTATAFRTDDKSLGETFDTVCCNYGLKWAIENGYLVPIESVTVPLDIDLSGVKSSCGDFQKGQLADVITPLMEEAADQMVEHGCLDEKVLVFLPTKVASKRFQKVLHDRGFRAGHIDGDSKNRKEVLKGFHEAKTAVLCNPMVLSMGYDEPSITVVIDLTPTRSTLLYIQKIGRGTRPINGHFPEHFTATDRKKMIAESSKPRLKILDFLWHSATKDLCHPARLFAKTKEVEEKMVAISAKGGSKNVQEVENEAHEMLVSEREQALASSLKAFKGNKSMKFDPVLQAVSLFDDTLVNWRPETKSEAKNISKSQEKYLTRNGFDCSGWQKGYAAKVMESITDQLDRGLATPRMQRCLRNNGYGDAALKMSMKDSKAAMDKLTKKWERQAKYRKKR